VGRSVPRVQLRTLASPAHARVQLPGWLYTFEGDRMNIEHGAQQHARHLIKKLGSRDKALEVVQQKIDDAPFVVGQDRGWWIAVKEALR